MKGEEEEVYRMLCVGLTVVLWGRWEAQEGFFLGEFLGDALSLSGL